MKYTQKPVSIYPKNVLLQSHEMLHFVAISHEYQILNVFKTSSSCPYRVPDIATWSYQTRCIHLLITHRDTYLFPVTRDDPGGLKSMS